MNRRSFLQTARAATPLAAPSSSLATATNTLSPYTGPWDTAQAAHLLRRTTFGPNPTQIRQAVTDGLSATIGALFAPQPLPPPPVYYNYSNDPNAVLGETWVNTPPPVPPPPGLLGARRRSLTAWQMGLCMNGGVSIREKMVLFWHNHFAISDINNGQFGYQYLHILRTHALGDFRSMAEEITVSPAMLLYLNGNQNTRQAPNENYARELLELFTIGRGPVAAPGDYTFYTEDDVVALARALTGWVTRTLATGQVAGVYVNNRHDQEQKQLSHRFHNAIISNAGDQEYRVVIDLILQQEEVARYLSRQLHIWFVGARIDPAVEANTIEPMAQLILANNYQIQPAVEALLASEYFFLATNQGCMITHPIDYLFKILNTCLVSSTAPLLPQYRFWDQLYQLATDQDMELMGLPSVAGWKAFYQSPQYDEIWINSVTLVKRQETSDRLANGLNVFGFRWEPDLLAFIAEIDNNLDPNALISGIATYLFAEPLASNQLSFLKEVLIPGLPDFEWTLEYSEYLQDPTNPELRDAVLTKLQSLCRTLFKMPEFYLI